MAPVVILAKSGAINNPQPNARIEYRDNSAEGYLIAVAESGSDGGRKYPLIETDRFDEEKNREIQSVKEEYKRMVYVAATRARNVLIINQPMSIDKNGKSRKGSSNKWRDLIKKAEGDIFEAIPEIVKVRKDDAGERSEPVNSEDLYSAGKPLTIREDSTYSLNSPNTLTSSSRYEEISEEREGVDEYKDSGETYSTLIGTMVHRLMEMIIMSRDSLKKETLVNNILSEYMVTVLEKYRGSFRRKLESVYDVMHNGGYPQTNGAEQDILPVILNADEAYSEVPFTHREGNEIWNGIIDLIYRKDGRLHIIDWKTNRSDEGLAEHYKEQLNAYREAVKRTTGEDVENALIYHISIS